MQIRVAGLILAILGIALIGTGVAFAHGSNPVDTAVSGIELSIGRQRGDIRVGVIFTGQTNEGDGSVWVAPNEEGGTWSTIVNYTGTPGLGGSVEFVGGFWALNQPDGTKHWGRILGGQVLWPDRIDESVEPALCGPGVALLMANLSLGLSGRNAGLFTGCLDDTHNPSPSNPPKIWGYFDLNHTP